MAILSRLSRAEHGSAVVAVLATLLAGAVLLLLQSTATTVGAALLLIVLTTTALKSASKAALDAVLMADLLYAAVAVGLLWLWPLPAAVAVVGAWLLARRSARAELWRSWLRRGRITPEVPVLLLGTVMVTAVALVAWQQVFGGRLPEGYRDVAQGRPVWLILSAGAAFTLVNAAVEEAIFRGVLQTSLHHVIGPAGAVLVQAVAFGLLHVLGIPTGLIGAVMAGSWGVLLGILRLRTQGVLAPYVAHVGGRPDDRHHAASRTHLSLKTCVSRPTAPGGRGR